MSIDTFLTVTAPALAILVHEYMLVFRLTRLSTFILILTFLYWFRSRWYSYGIVVYMWVNFFYGIVDKIFISESSGRLLWISVQMFQLHAINPSVLFSWLSLIMAHQRTYISWACNLANLPPCVLCIVFSMPPYIQGSPNQPKNYQYHRKSFAWLTCSKF